MGISTAESFGACKNFISNKVTLSHRNFKQCLLIYTDARNNFWSGIAAQIPVSDSNLRYDEKHHSPLAFLSGRFNATQMRFSVLGKERYADLATIICLHWLTATPEDFDLLINHNNLVSIFDSPSLMPNLFKPCVGKVHRRAVRLSTYS